MSSSLEALKTHIENAINNAENNTSKITDNIIKMEGMTGTKTRHFYNNLLNINDARYLEIGTWKGSSVCSAMCNNSATVVCIDNWSEFGGPKNEFLKNFNMYKGKNNASFIEDNCYNINVKTLPKFNIYMYDGNHTENSHHRALTHFIDCLDDTFIFIVDDWNWHGVRKGTVNSIKSLNLNVLYTKEIFTDNIINGVKETWWNGIYIAILQKPCVNNISKDIDYKTIDCDYTFYEGLDSGGNDIKCIGKNSLDKLIQTANSTLDCVAFNTLGYLKYSITLPLIKSPYVNSPHGIFIKNISSSTSRN